MKNIFILFFLLSSVTIFSQNKVLDSLNAIFENVEKNTPNHVNILNDIGLQFWIVDSKKSIEYGNTALKLSDSLKYLLGSAKANRVIGVAHWTQGNYVEAIKFLDASHKIFESIDNSEGVANVILNQAMVYADLKDDKKALSMYEDAIVKFTALNLKGRIATTYTKIGSLYLDQNKFEHAKVHLDNALVMHSESDYTYGISEAHNRLGILYLELNELEQAFYHISKSINLSRELNDANGMTSSLLYFGKLLFKDKQFKHAEDHINLALNSAKENNFKRYELLSYEALKELKTEQGDYKVALEYYNKYSTLKDSIFNSDRAMQITALEFKNELHAKNQEVKLLTENQEKNRLFQWGLSIGFIGLVISSFIFFFSYKKQTKQRKEIALSKELLAKTAIENSRLKEQELQQLLEYKNKELTSYTLNFIQKNELLAQLQEKLEDFKNAPQSEKGKLLNNLNILLKQHINIDKNWQDFKRVFEEVHSNFISKLKEKHSDLSANDLKICALTRLNLNIKETASMIGITPESAKTARYRLRKKLNLEKDQELLGYFLELEQL